jgi:quercetin dioxygenase-like cupin family protein
MAIIQHRTVPPFEMQGNLMMGIATPSRGAQQIEAWFTTIAPGAATPLHVHDAEEIVVVLRGRGQVRVQDAWETLEAPCTLITPRGVPHQITNTGDETLEAVAAMPVGSSIRTPDGALLDLPWRG